MLETATNIVLDRLLEASRHQPRKTAMAGVIAVTIVVLFCHFVFQGPALSTAAVLNSAASDNSTGDAPPITTPTSVDAMNQWLKEQKQPARRNLFALNLEDYPADATVNPVGSSRASHDQKDQTLWDDVAKSMATQADHKREQDLRVKNLQRAAAKLRVEKIMIGPPARAQVNGETIEEGSTVASLHVLQIATDRITVEKDGVTQDIPLSP